jgi:hypothetical protein
MHPTLSHGVVMFVSDIAVTKRTSQTRQAPVNHYWQQAQHAAVARYFGAFTALLVVLRFTGGSLLQSIEKN